jgi:hypothetical protein
VTSLCVRRDWYFQNCFLKGPIPSDAQILAEKLKMPVEDLMRQINGKASPPKALVKGLAKELNVEESFLSRLVEEVRRDLG